MIEPAYVFPCPTSTQWCRDLSQTLSFAANVARHVANDESARRADTDFRRAAIDDSWALFSTRQRSRQAHTVLVPKKEALLSSQLSCGWRRYNRAHLERHPKIRVLPVAPQTKLLNDWSDALIRDNARWLRRVRQA